MASVTSLRDILEPTSLPADLIDEMLAETNSLWLLGASDALVAGELVLCHPALGPGEVRAVVNETKRPDVWRVTVVTKDRSGLLAATSAILSSAGFSITDAATTVLPRSQVALQRLSVTAARPGRTDVEWSRLGRDLRDTLTSNLRPEVAFVPRRPVVVEAQPQDLGRSVVTIEAPDGIGLLHTIASWFESARCNIDAGRLGMERNRVRSVFVVTGSVDTASLAAALGGTEVQSVVTRVATTPLHLTAALARRAMETSCDLWKTARRLI